MVIQHIEGVSGQRKKYKLKNKGLIISALIFFLIVNTNSFWEGKLELLAFPIFIFLVTVFFALLFFLLRQLFIAFKESFRNKNRIITIAIITIVLVLIFLKPNGLVNFNKPKGKDLLIAQKEGGANCMTTIKLKENNKFRERSVCFGATKIKGIYELRNDTIFFKNIEYERNENEYYEFAVIKSSKFGINKNKYVLVRFKNLNDTIGHELLIIKNELKTNKTKPLAKI